MLTNILIIFLFCLRLLFTLISLLTPQVQMLHCDRFIAVNLAVFSALAVNVSNVMHNNQIFSNDFVSFIITSIKFLSKLLTAKF